MVYTAWSGHPSIEILCECSLRLAVEKEHLNSDKSPNIVRVINLLSCYKLIIQQVFKAFELPIPEYTAWIIALDYLNSICPRN